MTTMPYRIDRTLVIHALPDTVFSFFTSSERWASWWGAGSTIRQGWKVNRAAVRDWDCWILRRRWNRKSSCDGLRVV